MHSTLKQRLQRCMPAVEFCAFRYVEFRSETVQVRQSMTQAPENQDDCGVMVTIIDQGGYGYAATSDLSEAGLTRAVQQALCWVACSRDRLITPMSLASCPPPVVGEYVQSVQQPWHGESLAHKVALLQAETDAAAMDSRIVDSFAELEWRQIEQLYLSSHGSEIWQHTQYLIPKLCVIGNHATNTQRRSFGGGYTGQQGGLERLTPMGFEGSGRRLAEEVLQLLAAPNCPSQRCDLLLAPDQMVIQVHESIGHPLELDRILGDERNYAGTSFITPELFGHYQYGSELLNVTFDPCIAHQFASYGYDDDGLAAQKSYLIERGVLKRPLGGFFSQQRAQLHGTANARACHWNRPPIDRMANLNIEVGEQSVTQLISEVEHGILMRSNRSWSIDDSRNKFQFGCEWGQLIENGQLTQVVKNPNYRGISATFWRNLTGLADANSFEVLGVSSCGKGEPHQMIFVGHAAPMGRFRDVDVFGGA